jgi:hypothetical protein
VSASYEEAARVCLDRHHTPPSSITIRSDDGSRVADLIWDAPSERERAAWANALDATRDGAYAVVLASAELVEELFAVRRAEHATGADYYVAPSGTDPDDLEECFRLEVSGSDAGTTPDLERRLRVKLDQTKSGASNLPALAGVVGFGVRLVLMARVEE